MRKVPLTIKSLQSVVLATYRLASVKLAELSEAPVAVGVQKTWYISSCTGSLISFLRRDAISLPCVQETCAHAFVPGLRNFLARSTFYFVCRVRLFCLQRADSIFCLPCENLFCLQCAIHFVCGWRILYFVSIM